MSGLVHPERRDSEVFLPRQIHVEVGEERGDLGQLEVVLGDLDAVAGGQDIGVILQDIGADLIVIVVGYEPIDLAGDLRERELGHAEGRHQRFPVIEVRRDRLLVRQAIGKGLCPQGRRLVRSDSRALLQPDLEPIDLVAELRQRPGDDQGLDVDQHREIRVAHRRWTGRCGRVQGQDRIVQAHLGRGRLRALFSAHDDGLVDEATGGLGRVIIVRGILT